MTMRDTSIYSDIEQSPEILTDSIARDVQAVAQALSNLIATFQGERLFNNSGLNPENSLFELGDGNEVSDFLSELVREINNQEPRIIINQSLTQVIPDYDNNKSSVRIVYQLDGLETESFELIRSLS
jgi:phage baseplate assembly protein W